MIGEAFVYFVRHGYTKWNSERKYIGHTDQSLLTESLERLDPVRAYFADRVSLLNPIYCSDYIRCRETLDYILPCLDPETVRFDARLRETSFGAWEGHTYEQLKDDPLYRQWLDQPEQVTPPAGEPWSGFQTRVQAFTSELQHNLLTPHTLRMQSPQSAHALIVTHGGVIRMMLTQLVPGLSFWKPQVPVGSVIRLTLHMTLEERWEAADWQTLVFEQDSR